MPNTSDDDDSDGWDYHYSVARDILNDQLAFAQHLVVTDDNNEADRIVYDIAHHADHLIPYPVHDLAGNWRNYLFDPIHHFLIARPPDWNE